MPSAKDRRTSESCQDGARPSACADNEELQSVSDECCRSRAKNTPTAPESAENHSGRAPEKPSTSVTGHHHMPEQQIARERRAPGPRISRGGLAPERLSAGERRWQSGGGAERDVASKRWETDAHRKSSGALQWSERQSASAAEHWRAVSTSVAELLDYT
jgi:hypothetical protein